MNFLYAVLIGGAVGLAGALALRRKQSNALTLGPAAGIAGAVVASILAAIFGREGYSWKEFTAQLVFAVVGVAALAFLAGRGQPTGAAPPSQT